MENISWNSFDFNTFCFDATPISVNKENIKGIILSIDEAVIFAGMKYQIFMPLTPNLLFCKGIRN